MQRPDERKRKDILKVAERLFAAHPFHEVKLERIAARAGIGKGTIYIYFRSKEDVYASLVREGMAERNQRLRQLLSQRPLSCLDALRLIITELVNFATARPGMYQILRTVSPTIGGSGEHRRELITIITDVIQRGAQAGEVCDPEPQLTAQFIVASVRGTIVFGKDAVPPHRLADHLTSLLANGIAKPTARPRVKGELQ
jgi:AcrR family transcriptional regulator